MIYKKYLEEKELQMFIPKKTQKGKKKSWQGSFDMQF